MLTKLILLSLIYSAPTKLNKQKCKDMKIDNSLKIVRNDIENDYKKKTPMLIDMKFFVIHDNDKGKITKKRINDQINILNDAFGGKQHELGVNSKILFRLKQLVYINDNKLYKSCGKSEDKIVSKYPGDTRKYISVYTCDDDYLGYAYYPTHEKEGDKTQVVFMNEIAITGSKQILYNIGMTLVHELGHFFGLPHTFNYDRKCSNNGDDGYTDTPIEKTPNYWCNANRDTCPNHSGKDPIWNYMDYSPDSCMNRFTKQQVNDMIANIDYYRPKLKKFSINNYLKTTTSTTITTKTKTTTSNTLETTTSTTSSTTSSTTPIPPWLYKYCKKKSKSKCIKLKKCRWHDHYIKCYPESHEDTIKIYCDVRDDEDRSIRSKKKCKSKPFKKKCKWNNNKEKCVPRK